LRAYKTTPSNHELLDGLRQAPVEQAGGRKQRLSETSDSKPQKLNLYVHRHPLALDDDDDALASTTYAVLSSTTVLPNLNRGRSDAEVRPWSELNKALLRVVVFVFVPLFFRHDVLPRSSGVLLRED